MDCKRRRRNDELVDFCFGGNEREWLNEDGEIARYDKIVGAGAGMAVAAKARTFFHVNVAVIFAAV